MRIAIGVEYNGQAYSGWQKQHHAVTVQESLEKAIEQVATHSIALVCAGRTDAGVHATQQVAHFDTSVKRPLRAWVFGVNAHLPQDISVQWAIQVADDFSARFSAQARRYRYIIYNGSQKPAILQNGLTHVHQQLDATRMHQAAQLLIGEHDFSSFRAAQCQSNSPWREVQELKVFRVGQYVVIDIQANAFVHHMVRNIAGALIAIGTHEKDKAWLASVLAARDRRVSAATAKANGLYLCRVIYPEHFKIPETPLGPLFLED